MQISITRPVPVNRQNAVAGCLANGRGEAAAFFGIPGARLISKVQPGRPSRCQERETIPRCLTTLSSSRNVVVTQ